MGCTCTIREVVQLQNFRVTGIFFSQLLLLLLLDVVCFLRRGGGSWALMRRIRCPLITQRQLPYLLFAI